LKLVPPDKEGFDAAAAEWSAAVIPLISIPFTGDIPFETGSPARLPSGVAPSIMPAAT